MIDDLSNECESVCASFGDDPTRLLDVLREVQRRRTHVSDDAVDVIARRLGREPIDVARAVEFYAFLSREPQGRTVIRLCDDYVDRMAGYEKVRDAFIAALGVGLGETTPDGRITLTRTPCIGMSDQGPAALIDDVVVTRLTEAKVRRIVAALEHDDPAQLVTRPGDGQNAHRLINAMVRNNVRQTGPLLSQLAGRGATLSKALGMSPAEVIRTIKTARLRGAGGAGFPTGLKWEFARSSASPRKFIFCNADEGEPGTFKDRVLLTERPDRLFAGMTIAAYAVGAGEGVVYLRAEYAYLLRYLEDILAQRRGDGLLGTSVMGRDGFDFDIRIQLGAGSYLCGAESALLASCEGGPGEPKNRPPYPVESGYLGCPAVVNNVETLAAVAKILETGPAAFSAYGIGPNSGPKLLSISGDCDRPGIYEVQMGTPLGEVLALCGGDEASAVLVGGPSGQIVGRDAFERVISYDDLSTGGALIAFGSERNVPEIIAHYLGFFAEESCGYCAPCRVGNVLLKEGVDRILAGRGEPSDLDELTHLGRTVKATSRCGLGQSSPNALLSSLETFRPTYETLVESDPDGFRRSFDLEAAVATAKSIATRLSVRGKELES